MAAATVRLFLLLLPLCLSLTIVSATATVPVPELIRETCMHAKSHHDLCVAVLSSDPKSNTSDVRGLLEIALKLTTENLTKTADFVADFLDEADKKSTEPGLQQCLAYCEDEYIDAVDQLTNAAAALESKVYKDVEKWVAVAMADVKACQQECRDIPGDKRGLTKKNGDVDRLCSITLTINQILL
ncbi:putative Pectinesterase inhibitor [Cocos nucifera]|uniref:Putative Pectinesterase inhibitor n=1 Tax=Cocos nucifera TaxID=13894 RepID=A0A8K0IYE7_COCNU|nr:putative Pectinesterase inhibitor [Cocos nucifera]